MRHVLRGLATTLIVLMMASAALADGGKSIGSAPIAWPDQDYFGNTANGAETPEDFCESGERSSWWRVPVRAGDRVLIDFTANQSTWLQAYPIGTNDYTLASSGPAYVADPTSTGRNRLDFFASRNGEVPMRFWSTNPCEDVGPGPYSFRAHLVHRVWARHWWVKNDRRRHRTRFGLSLRDTNGHEITDGNLVYRLQYCCYRGLPGGWKSGPVFRWPTRSIRVDWGRSSWHKWRKVKLTAWGFGYQSVMTGAIRIRVP